MANELVDEYLNEVGVKHIHIDLADGGGVRMIKDRNHALIAVSDKFGDDAVVAVTFEDAQAFMDALVNIFE